MQTIANNFYLDPGASAGIGEVQTLVTTGARALTNGFDAAAAAASATATQFSNGTVTAALNASSSSLGNWAQGADGYPVFTNAVVLTRIELSGTYKTSYYVGDSLDLTGLVVTAFYSDGTSATLLTSDATINGYDKNSRGAQTVTLSYGAVSAEISVTVLQSGTPGTTITVTFSLLGDAHHDSDTDGTKHTLKDGNLTTWIAEKSYTVDINATVWDVIKKALDEAGITYSNPTGNYIEYIERGGVRLGEFSNGVKSGWLYTLNGKNSLLGISEQYLSSGDKIVFHYSDDYTAEDSSADLGGTGGGTGGGASGGNSIDDEDTPLAGSPDGALPYTDVKSGDWFYDAVKFVTEHGLMNGTAADKFSPNSSLTRAMLVTVLYRVAGSPEVTRGEDAPFADVPDGEWYSDAVLWASENGIVLGYGNGKFGPNDALTREQLVTILHRYAGLPAATPGALAGFTDVSKVSAYAVEAFTWAVGGGLIAGRTATTLSPQGTATRAEVATILARYVEGLEQ
jgi:hypothetical protein